MAEALHRHPYQTVPTTITEILEAVIDGLDCDGKHSAAAAVLFGLRCDTHFSSIGERRAICAAMFVIEPDSFRRREEAKIIYTVAEGLLTQWGDAKAAQLVDK
jgi:hypothetical protein